MQMIATYWNTVPLDVQKRSRLEQVLIGVYNAAAIRMYIV